MLTRRALLFSGTAAFAAAQTRGYDESKVRHYTLPDPLTLSDGERVKTAAIWQQRRRPELLRLFETNEYGKLPRAAVQVRFSQPKVDSPRRRKLVTGHITRGSREHTMDILLYLPKTRPAPVFVGVNFRGNHTVSADPDIPVPTNWLADNVQRGMQANQWPLDRILDRGYGLATIYSGDLWPDFAGGQPLGIAPLFFDEAQTERGPEDFGALGAWAWGLSRTLDYLETDSDVDARRVAVIGHSRMGKAALWAGAQDTRFAMVVSNCSGAAGAALARRRFGESVKEIGGKFPFWFCENYRKFADNEDAMPMDQHELLALCAPRPLYVAVADQDLGSDPKGQWLAALNAAPVYRLLGTDGLAASEMPAVHQPVMSHIGFHVRAGRHDLTPYDWDRYLDFANKHLGKRS